ncbi:hypothetical protein IW140_001686 [Coemansia sp. RSA 1813]|nr:hypothetical protein EV178_001482 [Coemansia sp. RSA 1646]KAJ1772539.1 hypothetical protein LPJ74_001440 [Coemansia sp. RSA 1843]KAJ2090942.1 hypothetical protein IW138_002346 [Coemansia sp. RSA 986]KAJ2213990.1 hypothetical protein EV179_003345 [Coemansia sp. RSA 487]KAJ2571232.1 hypothetical protein IW140_001686 [Coemansia sp. RSA 1813]
MIVVSPMRSHSLPIGDIPTQVFRSAEPYRDEVVLIDAESERQFTIDDIITTSTKLAAGLTLQGHGGRVISVFDNTQLQSVYVYYAALMAGGAYQSLDTDVSEGDLQNQISFTQTPAIFTSHAHLSKLLGVIKGLDISVYVFDHPRSPNSEDTLACAAGGIHSSSSSSSNGSIAGCACDDGAESGCCAPVADLLIDDPTFVPVRITSKNDAMRKPAYLAYLPDVYGSAASATHTQRPLTISHYSLLSSQRLSRPPGLLDAHRTAISAVPFSGAHGINVIAHFPMLSGSRVIQLNKSNPSKCLSAIEKWKAGILLANYPVLASIDAAAKRVGDRIAVGSDSFDANSLSVIFIHELRVPQAFKERIAALFQARLVELYSYIETGLIAGVITEHPRIDGSVGVLCPSVKARVVMNGSEVDEGEYGEIHVSTPRLEFSEENKFFCTGDYGKITADGVVIIKARMKDLIHTKSNLIVAPTDIEKTVLANTSIVDCAAFGIPADGDPGGGDGGLQLPFVYVVPATDNGRLDMNSILEPLAKLYPGICGSFIDHIPKCDKGEPRRLLLREIATKKVGSQ